MNVLPDSVRRCLEFVNREIGCIECLIEGEPTIIVCGGRNWNLSVGNGAHAKFHLKLLPEDAERTTLGLGREVDFYTFCHNRLSRVGKHFLPRLLACDRDWPFLALESLQGAAPLWKHIRASRLRPVALLENVGKLLGTIHADFRDSTPHWAKEPVASPWVMNAHQPATELLATLSPAVRQLLGIVQSDAGLPDRLDALRAQWKPQTLIHGDLRSDNILVFPPDPGREYAVDQIRFIDWETVRYGDPAWDVAGVLQDTTFFWICSICEGETNDIDRMVSCASFPWLALQDGFRGFWRGYRCGAGVGRMEADGLLARAVQFSAARMIQTAWEVALTLPALPVESLLLLQAASNLLDDSNAARVQFYGLIETTA